MLNLFKLRNIFICLINKEYQYVGWLGSSGKGPLFYGKDNPSSSWLWACVVIPVSYSEHFILQIQNNTGSKMSLRCKYLNRGYHTEIGLLTLPDSPGVSLNSIYSPGSRKAYQHSRILPTWVKSLKN